MADRKNERNAKRIIITGLVQGIGFRPHIYDLAVKTSVYGSVKNIGGAVEILCEGNTAQIRAFISAIRNEHIPFENISAISIEDIEPKGAKTFTIAPSISKQISQSRQSNQAGRTNQAGQSNQAGRTNRANRPSAGAVNANVQISPDLPVCSLCADEITNKSDRRHKHFFNSCTSCGPRFSIIKSLPYDRTRTSMDAFFMCEKCEMEYNLPENRRFHAETVCCNDCGPTLLFKSRSINLTAEEAFIKAINILQKDGLLMIKGVGGYHLACSPFSHEAVLNLRKMKGREHKPFAVMFNDINQIELLCGLKNAERELLRSPARPIVPLMLKNPDGCGFDRGVLEGDLRCGCFLPYTPLHILILQKISPLVMTSSNLSGSAIIYKDCDALRFLENHSALQGILYNDRAIIRPVEDSVAAILSAEAATAAISAKIRVIRMGRGYAPLTLPMNCPAGKQTANDPATEQAEQPLQPGQARQQILAAGGDLKSSFCLVKNDCAHISQYFGDLIDAEAYNNYANEINAQEAIFDAEPTKIAADLHPGYISSSYAKQRNLPVYMVQHHHAHVASVIAEHDLRGKIIGAAFDGTGYGTDGAIWGGEFFICDGANAKRAAHLDYVDIIGGDSASADAKKTASCYLYKNKIEAFDNIELIKTAISQNINCTQTSSMGRLFDAVTAILGIAGYNTYEGECAILLQQAAERALKNGEKPLPLSFDLYKESNTLGNMVIIKYDNIIKAAHNFHDCHTFYNCHTRDNQSNLTSAFALGFHYAIADMVCDVSNMLGKESGAETVVLSGGVFDNSLLTERCICLLETAGYKVYIGNKIPAGDGGIALGQAYAALNDGKLS